MVILGLDPGLARTGFGLINMKKPQAPEYITCGCLTTPHYLTSEDRLVMLGEDLEKLIGQHRPDLAVIEQVFFGKNVKTALMTAEARGVLLYVLRGKKIPVEHVTPLQIKSRLTGYGAADKQQVQRLIMQRLHLAIAPAPDDAADALAAALCAVQPVGQTI